MTVVTGSELSDIDLRTAAASHDPYAVYSGLRHQGPVVYNSAHRAWLVTSHPVVGAAYTRRELSSDRIRPLVAGGGGARTEASASVLGLMSDWMVVSDAPGHTRLRKVAAAAFKKQQISMMTERIEARVDALLDAFIGAGEQDLVEHVAHPLPGSLIAELLGAPSADQDLFREWSDELALVAFGTGGEAQEERHQRAFVGLRSMSEYFRELLEQARSAPDESMLSVLLAPQANGEQLSDDEVLSMCALLLFAGHETTINSIANGVHALLRHPGQLALLQNDPTLVPTAVEEMLRYDGPVKVIIRWVKDEVELGGRQLRASDRVYLINAAANRDPAVFQDPDDFDVMRTPNAHLAFGRGVHACIGAQLARIEMRVAVEKIIARLPGLCLLDAEPVWQPSLGSRAMRTLRVAHDAS